MIALLVPETSPGVGFVTDEAEDRRIGYSNSWILSFKRKQIGGSLGSLAWILIHFKAFRWQMSIETLLRSELVKNVLLPFALNLRTCSSAIDQTPGLKGTQLIQYKSVVIIPCFVQNALESTYISSSQIEIFSSVFYRALIRLGPPRVTLSLCG